MWTLYSQCVCNAFRPDNREDKRLLSACLCLFVSNKLSSFEWFSFMASWLGVLGYVHTGPVPNGSDPILERTISVHTVPFRLSTSVHTGPVCYCSVLNRSKKSSCFYQLSMRRIHVVAFKMAPKYQKEPVQVFTR